MSKSAQSTASQSFELTGCRASEADAQLPWWVLQPAWFSSICRTARVLRAFQSYRVSLDNHPTPQGLGFSCGLSTVFSCFRNHCRFTSTHGFNTHTCRSDRGSSRANRVGANQRGAWALDPGAPLGEEYLQWPLVAPMAPTVVSQQTCFYDDQHLVA